MATTEIQAVVQREFDEDFVNHSGTDRYQNMKWWVVGYRRGLTASQTIMNDAKTKIIEELQHGQESE